MTYGEINTYFIDESGHSGDIAKPGRGLDFLDQPYFVLGAVGVPHSLDVASELAALRLEHRLPPGELKSKSLGSKPAFVEAVFDMVHRHELPVLLEVVDKRYYVGTNIVQFVLRRGLDMSEGPTLHRTLNVLAELLHQEAPDEVFEGFIDACAEPSDERIMTVFGRLIKLGFAQPRQAKNFAALEMLDEVVKSAGVAYVQRRGEDPKAYEHLVPHADLNRAGKGTRMLPNQSSFANIFARINLFRGGRMEGVRLVHDEQLEAANIIQSSMAQLEAIKAGPCRPYTPHANYVVDGGASLEFAKSDVEPGIQLADVMTGTVMRFYRDLLHSPGSIAPAVKRAVVRVLAAGDPRTGIGINLVAPDSLVFAGHALLRSLGK
jgi:hypothetical protein